MNHLSNNFSENFHIQKSETSSTKIIGHKKADKKHQVVSYQHDSEAPQVTWLIVLISCRLIGRRLDRLPEHFRSSILQRKARRRQATIGWLHPRKAEIDQSDLSVVGLTFIQQVLQNMHLGHKAILVVVNIAENIQNTGIRCRKFTSVWNWEASKFDSNSNHTGQFNEKVTVLFI